jgi:hypothetical protein
VGVGVGKAQAPEVNGPRLRCGGVQIQHFRHHLTNPSGDDCGHHLDRVEYSTPYLRLLGCIESCAACKEEFLWILCVRSTALSGFSGPLLSKIQLD